MNSIEKLTINTLKKYMGACLERCSVHAYGRLITIDLIYHDFKPLNEVRKWVNENVPYLWALNIERTYSRRILCHTISEMADGDVNMQIHLEELLFAKDFSNNVRQGREKKAKKQHAVHSS